MKLLFVAFVIIPLAGLGFLLLLGKPWLLLALLAASAAHGIAEYRRLSRH